MTDDITPVPSHGFATPAEVEALRATIAGLEARVEALRFALIGIRRASDFRRKERKSTGEDHEYYFHTADAALSGGTPDAR